MHIEHERHPDAEKVHMQLTALMQLEVEITEDSCKDGTHAKTEEQKTTRIALLGSQERHDLVLATKLWKRISMQIVIEANHSAPLLLQTGHRDTSVMVATRELPRKIDSTVDRACVGRLRRCENNNGRRKDDLRKEGPMRGGKHVGEEYVMAVWTTHRVTGILAGPRSVAGESNSETWCRRHKEHAFFDGGVAKAERGDGARWWGKGKRMLVTEASDPTEMSLGYLGKGLEQLRFKVLVLQDPSLPCNG
ncbi:hypothetical protein B0H14DRAFT_2627442 [Mycena olivaceomarginata]|nr:hypothetical protein B0H14DRAFT_2627442 [Mycena olivaceomarginata]